jgi:hypothetical protein
MGLNPAAWEAKILALLCRFIRQACEMNVIPHEVTVVRPCPVLLAEFEVVALETCPCTAGLANFNSQDGNIIR